tara:strand:+ start:1215 stop:1352 length:138 start_codon:yes stop_codon:yes gene_type:complete
LKEYKKIVNGLVWRRKLKKCQNGETFWHYYIDFNKYERKYYEQNK